LHLVGSEPVVTSVFFREFVVANRSCEISEIWKKAEGSYGHVMTHKGQGPCGVLRYLGARLRLGVAEDLSNIDGRIDKRKGRYKHELLLTGLH